LAMGNGSHLGPPSFSLLLNTKNKDMGQGPALKIHSFNSIRAMVHH
jgi:hypothetical protein